MDGHMFDGLISGLLIIGAGIGIALCAAAWLIYWLCSHISISWVS